MDISPHRLLERAKERFQLADYFGCIHLLEDLIEGGRAFADAHHLLGLAYHESGELDKAVEVLERAVALRSPTPELLNALAEDQAQSGNTDRARELFERSLEAQPDQPAVQEQLERLKANSGL